MVCVAAFIILCLVGVFVAFLSIFRRDIGRKYWAVFKKAWGCVGKKIRLQKCETNFKDDVKNSLLSRVVLKHPRWVKPLGTAIEVSAVLIVFITIWSLVESIKALLAIWVFGTCNVSQPASCALGAEVCGIDAAEPRNPVEWVGRWFSEWGEIFSNIPDRIQKINLEDYLVEPYTFAEPYADGRPLAIDVFDPGCIVCMQSYRNQKSSNFFSEYNVVPVVYVIKLPDGTPKFPNSDLFARYFYAILHLDLNYAPAMLNRLFTESGSDGINYQSTLASLSSADAEALLKSWLKDFGASKKEISAISEAASSSEVTDIMAAVSEMVESKLHAKGIPITIYDGKKHNGLFKND